MPSYRFCRPDDKELLIQAINTCVVSYCEDMSPLEYDDYQRLLRESDFWAGNCMLALGNAKDDVLSGVFGCRRDSVTHIKMLGTRKDQLRQGHMKHLITSLNNKLAILGPPNLQIEVDREDIHLKALLRGLKFDHKADFTSFQLNQVISHKLELPIDSISISQADSMNLLDIDQHCAWMRQKKMLINIANELRGAAIISSERIEGFVFYRDEGQREACVIYRIFSAEENLQVFRTLLAYVKKHSLFPIEIPRAAKWEVTSEIAKEIDLEEHTSWSLYHRATEELPS